MNDRWYNLADELINHPITPRATARVACCQPVRCLDTGQEFISLADLCRALGFHDPDLVIRRIKKGQPYNDLKFELLPKVPPKPKKAREPKPPKPKKEVVKPTRLEPIIRCGGCMKLTNQGCIKTNCKFDNSKAKAK